MRRGERATGGTRTEEERTELTRADARADRRLLWRELAVVLLIALLVTAVWARPF